jgi:hypothetical protein
MTFVKLLSAAAVVAALSTPSFAATMSAADCEAWFVKADANADGSVGGDEAKEFTAKLSGDTAKTKEAGIFMKDEFVNYCTAGSFAGIAVPAAQ